MVLLVGHDNVHMLSCEHSVQYDDTVELEDACDAKILLLDWYIYRGSGTNGSGIISNHDNDDTCWYCSYDH